MNTKILEENDIVMMRLFKLKPGSNTHEENNRIYLR